jgi:hypothetical protein
MGQVTHDQANLLLRLYELRREARLREARAWFNAKFWADSSDEMMNKYPPGSEENTNFRMVTSYWEMACGMVNRGLIDDEMFFESGAEFWFVWQKIKPIAAELRAMYHNPIAFAQMEATSKRIEVWWYRVAPKLVEGYRQRIAQMRELGTSAAKTS